MVFLRELFSEKARTADSLKTFFATRIVSGDPLFILWLENSQWLHQSSGGQLTKVKQIYKKVIIAALLLLN